MLEELDDDETSMLERLHEVNHNLDIEIDKLNNLIGDTGPRHSTKYNQIAIQLKDNLQRRVSETLGSRNSSQVSEESSATDLMGGIMEMDFAINRTSNRQSNRDSGRMPSMAASMGVSQSSRAPSNGRLAE